MASAFSASGDDIIRRQLHIAESSSNVSPGHFSYRAGHSSNEPEETLEEAYEIQRCLQWISQFGITKAALQFPDELLVDAPDVALAIEKKSKIEVYILGDTTYGSCCVDEVTAEHVGADGLIHFGRACLSHHNRKIPVLYIFENLSVEKEPFLTAFTKTFKIDDSVLLISDLRYHQSTRTLISDLQSYQNIILMELDIPEEQKSDTKSESNGNLHIGGRKCTIPDKRPVDQWTVLYIGEEGVALTNLMLTLNRCPFYSYNPKSHSLRPETMNVNQQLMKRFYVIEKTKDADLIGILVATLGVANYLDIIERVKRLITASGKKYYTFIVGKLNPAKLANFPEIDVYTLIACPENSLLDSRDFYRPVITPFELEVALNSNRQWTGDYTTDFRQLLPGASRFVEFSVSNHTEPDVSLVSGRMRTLGIEQDVGPSALSSQQVLPRSQSSCLSVVRSGSDFLNERSWQGLEPRIGETPAALAQVGRHGMASGYQGEGRTNSTDKPTNEMRGKPDGQE